MGVCAARRLLSVVALLGVTSAVPARGQDFMTMLQEAIAAQEQGDHDHAAELFLQLFDRSGGDLDLLYAAGRSFAQAGMTREAFQVLDRAIELGFVAKQALELDDQNAPRHKMTGHAHDCPSQPLCCLDVANGAEEADNDIKANS